MIKRIIQGRVKRHSARNHAVTVEDIRKAGVILFSVFARYGDSIISFKVINEFIKRHHGKKYIIITSNQTFPYARAIIRESADIFSVNMRKNPIKFLRISRLLKNAGVDLGFNPWSHGEDSEYFITYAEKFQCYKKFSRYPKEYNLYARIREYLLLENRDGEPVSCHFKDIGNIIIAPFSTDVTKSLSSADLEAMIRQVEARFPGAIITIASQKNEFARTGKNVERFIFRKRLGQSEKFLKVLKAADLFIGVDAGPLHLADALGVKAVGIFGPTAPETVLDGQSGVLTVRDRGLEGIFCFFRQCHDPICIHRLFKTDFLAGMSELDIKRRITLSEDTCRLPDAAG